ncbi:MAG TPA: crosslink repair DNA glycosylase YcaQ family protein [Actinomycetota bacterium]|nr:crosslink repair DNA glycosylase YcaQ family protein [Actinomycetota bacterium]
MQRLSGTPPRSSPRTVLGVIRSIRCVQLDPIAVVARSPHLVLGARVAGFDPKHLDRLLWRDRSVYEYWAHAASIVLAEDHPIHAWFMRRYLRDDGSAWNRRRLDWMAANARLRRSVLAQVRREGPVLARRISGGLTGESWRSSGWTNERNVDRMLGFLWASGAIMVAGREGIQKLWDLTERVLSPDAPTERLSDLEVTRRAVDCSLRGLGVGTSKQIRNHFTRDRYPELPRVLDEFERAGRVERVTVEHDGSALPGTWYVHRDDVPLLDRIERGGWAPRTTMLSPFDNLIADRSRSELLFDLPYRMEIYVPKAERRYGYYAMPVLDGDRFVALVDPAMDRANARLLVRGVHAAPQTEPTGEVWRSVAGAVGDLAARLGATQIELEVAAPAAFSTALR